MKKTLDYIRTLLGKIADNSATEADLNEIQLLLDQSDQSDDGGITPLLKEEWNSPNAVFTQDEMEQLAQSVLGKIRSEQPETVIMKKRIPPSRSWWWAAASVVLLMGIATWLWIRPNNTTTPEGTVVTTDLPPGQNGAVLTLADGRQLVLENLKDGVVAKEDGTEINLINGRVEYEPKGIKDAVTYNKMSTPKGRQFQLVLSDGTGVWLNAESSIEFPAVFSKTNREVTITGEVYFEVTKDAAAPFRVNISKVAGIDVLGTSFNVNAYDNEEQIQATLLNGAIRIVPASSKERYILKPGEQAQLTTTNGNTSVKIIQETDPERVLAWKNGAFSFEGLRLQEVLRQLQRWYDFKLVYKNKPPDMIYRGGIDRNVKFSEILEVLREMGLKYDWDGKTLIIH